MSTKLRDWRKRKKLTQKQLAEKLGVTEAHISLIEKGTRRPSAILIAKIERLAGRGLSVKDLRPDLYETDEKA